MPSVAKKKLAIGCVVGGMADSRVGHVIALFALCLAPFDSHLNAFDELASPPAGRILLPAEEGLLAPNPAVQDRLDSSAPWQEFLRRHGAWEVLRWNEQTRTPHRAIGASIPISGYRWVD